MVAESVVLNFSAGPTVSGFGTRRPFFSSTDPGSEG